jgi:hypothetical protein
MPTSQAQYRIVFGSDVDRDGVYLELARQELDGVHPIVEIFRSDVDGRITVTSEAEPVPSEWFSQLVSRAKTDLLGRPLDAMPSG